jgi:ribosome recycling factor
MSDDLINKMVVKMDKAIQNLKGELAKMRTGRASTALVDGITVDYYGSPAPVSQVGNVTTPDARTVQIVPWEPNLLGAIEKAILAANIGMTPQNDGKVIRIPLPALTEERRKDMVKQIKKMGEDSRVIIRNCRRDSNEEVKKLEKDKKASEDEAKKITDMVQKKTDLKVGEIDKIIADKEKEVMSI